MGKISPLGLGCHTYRHRTSYLPQLCIAQPFYKPLWLCLDHCLGCAHPGVENMPPKKAKWFITQWVLLVWSVAALKSYFWRYCHNWKHIHPLTKTLVFLPILGWVPFSAMRTPLFQPQLWSLCWASKSVWGHGKRADRGLPTHSYISPSHERGEKGSRLQSRGVIRAGWCNVAERVVPVSRRIPAGFAQLKCLLACCRHVQMSAHGSVGVKLQIFIFYSANGDQCCICN